MPRHHRNPIGDKSGCASVSMTALVGMVLMRMFRNAMAYAPGNGCDGGGRHRGDATGCLGLTASARAGRSWGDSSGQGC